MCDSGVSKHTFKIYILHTHALSGAQPKKQQCVLLLEGKINGLTHSVSIPNMEETLLRFLRAPVVLCDFHLEPHSRLTPELLSAVLSKVDCKT